MTAVDFPDAKIIQFYSLCLSDDQSKLIHMDADFEASNKYLLTSTVEVDNEPPPTVRRANDERQGEKGSFILITVIIGLKASL